MQQMRIVATACIGGIIIAFTWLVDFIPVVCTLGYLLILAAMALMPEPMRKEQQPDEPWYMK